VTLFGGFRRSALNPEQLVDAKAERLCEPDREAVKGFTAQVGAR